jgi:hypothetical protein
MRLRLITKYIRMLCENTSNPFTRITMELSLTAGHNEHKSSTADMSFEVLKGK